MVDYIEREAAIREMYKEPSYYDPVNILTEVRYRIKAIPAADVRPVEEVDAAVDEAIRVLNALNGTGRLDYGDYCELHDTICAISDADMRPVVRGEWIAVTNGRGGHECGVCHDYAPSFQDGSERLSNFCPNCGAKMEVSADA